MKVGDEKQGILARLSFFMDAYNKAYLSTEYSKEEKEIKLSQAKTQLDSWTNKLDSEYQRAILDTMEALDLGGQTYMYDDVVIYYWIIKGGCKTQICVSLRGADLAALAVLFKSNVDRDLTLYLADKTPITLSAPPIPIKGVINYFLSADYPEKLPFDTEN